MAIFMFPHTVTVLNKVEIDDEVMYYPTILNGVLYVMKYSMTKDTLGRNDNDTVKCTIPFSVSSSNKYIGEKEFEALSDDEKSDYWTLRKDDIIVKDIVLQKTDRKSLDYYRDSMMTITGVNINDFGNLKHWFVGGV